MPGRRIVWIVTMKFRPGENGLEAGDEDRRRHGITWVLEKVLL